MLFKYNRDLRDEGSGICCHLQWFQDAQTRWLAITMRPLPRMMAAVFTIAVDARTFGPAITIQVPRMTMGLAITWLCIGCTDASACNYDPEAVYNDGSCEYLSCETLGCTSRRCACNFDPLATADDGSCDFITCAGCTDPNADNYDPAATIDDGSCSFLGCLNPLACNYDPQANEADDSCEYESCIGCMNPEACNFDPGFTISDPLSCTFPEEGFACDGSCLNDADADGICDEFEVPGCTDVTAENFNEAAMMMTVRARLQ